MVFLLLSFFYFNIYFYPVTNLKLYSVVDTATIIGIDSKIISVEADVSDGMPIFEMVGSLGAEVKEAKERVRAALKNQGFSLPIKRITVNMSPVNIKKTGSGFDLPIAIAILSAIGIISNDYLDKMIIVGEISLDGKINSVNGILPMVIEAKKRDKSICIVPWDNVPEARLVPEISVIGAENLMDVIEFLNTGAFKEYELKDELFKADQDEYEYDFSLINGQPMLRRACEIAISGMHNFLMVGPPGAGKSMVAKCIPSILPPMTKEEQIELSKIYSVCGKLDERKGLIKNRPFRNPHHTISEQGLTGGGLIPRPGEISLAHGGVLFLDELTEFKKSSIEILRQPMEDNVVNISRVNGNFSFPARFILVAAMNPCSCGYYPDLNKCHCTNAQIQRYIGKISQPLMDRIDICVEAPALEYSQIVTSSENESSKDIRKRVIKCHELQKSRYAGLDFIHNSKIPSGYMDEFCKLGCDEKRYMEEMYEKNSLTARTYHKVLRVARTIADMAGENNIKRVHLQEALMYRGLDNSFWNGRC